jgi:hypothetical protein
MKKTPMRAATCVASKTVILSEVADRFSFAPVQTREPISPELFMRDASVIGSLRKIS